MPFFVWPSSSLPLSSRHAGHIKYPPRPAHKQKEPFDFRAEGPLPTPYSPSLRPACAPSFLYSLSRAEERGKGSGEPTGPRLFPASKRVGMDHM